MEALRELAESAAVQLRAPMDPYFFIIEETLAALSDHVVVGSGGAARRLTEPRPKVSRQDYEIEVWTPTPADDARAILVALAAHKPVDKDLHTWMAREGMRVAVGSYTLCRLRRAPSFRGTALTQLVSSAAGHGLFATDAVIPCMPPSALLYQIYTTLAGPGLPNGLSYREVLMHEHAAYGALTTTAGGADASAGADPRSPMVPYTQGHFEVSDVHAIGDPAAVVRGGAAARREQRPQGRTRGARDQLRVVVAAFVRKSGWPVVTDTPLMVALADDAPAAAARVAAELAKHGACLGKTGCVKQKRNLLLLPLPLDVPPTAKITLYVESGAGRYPICEFYETPASTPVMAVKEAAGVRAAPYTALQHLCAEVWIATALARSGGVPANVGKARVAEGMRQISLERGKLAAAPCHAIADVFWYGARAPVLRGKQKNYAPTVFGVDVGKPAAST